MLLCECHERKGYRRNESPAWPALPEAADSVNVLDGIPGRPIDLTTQDGLRTAVRLMTSDVVLQLQATLASYQHELRACVASEGQEVKFSLKLVQEQLSEITQNVKDIAQRNKRSVCSRKSLKSLVITPSDPSDKGASGSNISLSSEAVEAGSAVEAKLKSSQMNKGMSKISEFGKPCSPTMQQPSKWQDSCSGSATGWHPTESACSAHHQTSCLKKMVKHYVFDWFWALVIILNSLFMGAEAQFKAHNLNDSGSGDDFFKGVSWVFASLFAIELFLRCAAFGKAFFSCAGKEKWWNYFDTLLVVISFVEVMMLILHLDTSSQAATKRPLRLVRMVRLTRIVRVLRFCSPLRLMFFMIFEAIKSLGWFLVIMIVMLYVLGICFTQAATDYLKDGPGCIGCGSTPRYQAEASKYFGTLEKSVYTLLEALMGGQSWGEFCEVLFDFNPLIPAVFLAYISFALLCLLNIITGVFVDGALAKSQNERDIIVEKELNARKAMVHNLREVFEESDVDESGYMTYEEFAEVLAADERVRAYLSALEIDTKHTHKLFRKLDMDNNGVVSIEEFVEACIRLKGGSKTSKEVSELLMENRRVIRRHDKVLTYLEDKSRRMRSDLSTTSTACHSQINDQSPVARGNDSICSRRTETSSRQTPAKEWSDGLLFVPGKDDDTPELKRANRSLSFGFGDDMHSAQSTSASGPLVPWKGCPPMHSEKVEFDLHPA